MQDKVDQMMDEVHNWLRENPYIACGVATAAVLALYVGLRKRTPSIPMVPCRPNTVVLHTFDAGPNAPSMSPFPLKLECYLRMAKIPYMRSFKTPFSPTKTKTPWITYNGEYVTDSQFIIEYFNKKQGIDLDKGLTPEQKGLASAIRVMADEHLYWFVVYFRWMCCLNSDVMKHILPYWAFRKFVQRIMKGQLYSQGLGRHSQEEVLHIFRRDVGRLQDILGTKLFMMGSEPTQVDCSVFGVLANFIYNFSDGPIYGLIEKEYPSLYSYTVRMRDRLYPDDWELACQSEKEPHIFGANPGTKA